MGVSNPLFSFSVCVLLLWGTASAQLRPDYYKDICPDVEKIVRKAVAAKVNQTFVTIPAIIRLFFHDCFITGCDASVIIASTPTNKAEKDHEDNISLAGDGFDTVIKAKAAVDSVPRCKNKVSCADILALATRDVINLAGGPSYTVELGRMDGLSSTAASVTGNLPKPSFNLRQLNAMFGAKNLNENDMIALSACHTVGFAHCGKFANRIYNFSRQNPIDPTLNKEYAKKLQDECPRNVDDRVAIDMDPTTPRKFDNAYFKNLQQQKGLFSSDQALYAPGTSSRKTVDIWAANNEAFNNALVTALTKLGGLGVKNARNGNIRFDCGKFN